MLEILEFFWRAKERARRILAWNSRRYILRPKGKQRYGGSLCFLYPKFLGQEPSSWSKGSINNWFMLLLKNQLCVIIFKLSFFKSPFSSFTWTIISHTHRVPLLALPLSCWENHLVFPGPGFLIYKLWGYREGLPYLRDAWGRRKVPDGTGSSQVIHHSMLERKPNSQNEEFPFNKYLVIMLIFKPHNQSKSKSHLNGIYKRIRKWRK